MTVVLDGRPVLSYHGAYDAAGRVYAPLRPFVTRMADRIWFKGDRLVIMRAGRRIVLAVPSREPDALDHAYVPLASLARALGARVAFARGRLDVATGALKPVATPTPYAGETIPPRVVFTPAPVSTPRPVWTGMPLPRRTPLPYPTPR